MRKFFPQAFAALFSIAEWFGSATKRLWKRYQKRTAREPLLASIRQMLLFRLVLRPITIKIFT